MSQLKCSQQQEPSNDQDSTKQKAATTLIRSSITLDELLEILDDLLCEYEVHENPETNFCGIGCDLFDVEFVILPWGPGPFYDNFTFEAIRNPELDPETMCTQFNKRHEVATATPLDLNEDDEDDDTTDFVVAIKKMFSIDGGVTSEYVKRTIELWAGMLLHPVCFFEGPAVEIADGDETE